LTWGPSEEGGWEACWEVWLSRSRRTRTCCCKLTTCVSQAAIRLACPSMMTSTTARTCGGICSHNSGAIGGGRCIVSLHLSQLSLCFKFEV